VPRRKVTESSISREQALEQFARELPDQWDRFVMRLLNARLITPKEANVWRRG
jgi:hypothetical protein